MVNHLVARSRLVISFNDIDWSAVAGDDESKKSPGDPLSDLVEGFP